MKNFFKNIAIFIGTGIGAWIGLVTSSVIVDKNKALNIKVEDENKEEAK